MINVVSLKDAQKKIFDNLIALDFEIIKIEDSLNRVLFDDIKANENLPQFKRSIVDGYAIKSSNSVGVNQGVPGIFKYKGEILMGQDNSFELNDYETIYVPTGGLVPECFDAVAMIENCKKVNDEVLLYSPLKANENIINVGEDITKDNVIITKGTILNPYNIGLLAGLGIDKVKVYKKFKYSIISTGDEIIPITNKLEACKIRDINSYAIDAKLSSFGVLVNKYLIKDDFDLLTNTLNKALSESDYVFLSGGSSVGKKDFTIDVISQMSKTVLFHGVSIKPGKPTMASILDNKMIIGLPGHPMASLMSLDLIFVESLKRKMGIELDNIVFAKTSVNFPSSPGKTTIMPLKLTRDKECLYAYPLFYKSGLINILNKADGYMVIDEKSEGIYKDSIVEVRKI